MSRQRIALMDQNYCVTAGAGAGKTTCLVEAYLGLLGGNGDRPPLDPGQIVAITFTEKAAAEMRARVMAAAAEKASDTGGRWREVLPALEWAPITTIHSFCTTVLRDHGAGLGIDPDFSIMDADAFERMLEEAVDSLLRLCLSGQDDDLKLLLQHYSLGGAWGVAGMLTQACHGLATMGLTAAQAAEAAAQAHDEAIDQAQNLAAQLIGLGDELSALISGDDSLAKSKAKFATYLLDFIKQWPVLSGRLQTDALDSAAALGVEAALGPNQGGLAEIKDLRKQAKDTAKALAEASSLPDAAILTSALLGLLQRLEINLAREKTRRSALSFDDLLLMSLNLLEQRPNVLAGLRRQFRAIMVDEFQDVNPVQGRFVRLLCGLEGVDPGADADKPLLLVVGDRKQSIYAFRGADVSLFAQTMESFETGGWGSLVALQRNFRSHPRLIDFFNRIFERVFTQSVEEACGADCHVQFRPDDSQRPGRDEYAELGGPAVELLDCTGLLEDGGNAAAWRSAEADAVAAHLAAIIDSGEAAPGDIAILLRRMTQVALYEQALAQAGVAYYTVRGRGFFQCLEISDMANCLRVLLRPHDDLAAAAFLRSPLVGLHDESLLALVHGGTGEPVPLSQALRGDTPLPSWCGQGQARRLAKARALVAGFSPWATRMAPAELLTELSAATDYEAVLLAVDPGGQKAANLRKLIESARFFDGGVLQYFDDLEQKIARGDQDPQAPLMGNQGRMVRIMTIHQAKGLQFPVVVLCDLGAGRGPADSLPGPGPGGVISLRPIDFSTGQKPANPVYKALLQRRKAVDDAEAARLLYVACTRAERRLILSLTGAGRQGVWAQWVREFVADDPAVTTTKAVAVTKVGQVGPSIDAANLMLPPEPGPQSEQGRAIVQRCIAPGVVPTRLVQTSVSGMEDWLECPRRFVFTQRLGLDTASLPGSLSGDSNHGAVQRAVMLGSLVHNILELVDISGENPALEEACTEAQTRLQAPEELVADALAAASAFFDLPLATRLRHLPPEAILREQPFLLRLDADGPVLELNGEIDLAAPADDGGGWIIADYKVGRKLDPAKYRNQMLIYSTAWWRMLDRGPAPRAVLVHLGPGGAALHEMNFTPEDLGGMELRLARAAREICALGPICDPAQAPVGRDCHRDKCPLAPLCPEER